MSAGPEVEPVPPAACSASQPEQAAAAEAPSPPPAHPAPECEPTPSAEAPSLPPTRPAPECELAPTSEVELFECERYRVLAGWSADYLLPTDKQAIRARGTRLSWRSLAEAEAAVLYPGWVWDEDPPLVSGGSSRAWSVDSSGQQADADGWSYATNFSQTYEGSSKGGLQAFVRWRRLVRTASFAGADALQQAAALRRPSLAGAWPACRGCPNVDVEAAAQLGRQLAEALASASHHGEWCAAAVAKLKWQLLEELLASQKVSLEAALAAFVSSQKSVASRMAEAFKAGDDGASARTRLAEVEVEFPADEREAYAVLAMRRFRRDLACPMADEVPASHACDFAVIRCPHAGCKYRCSEKGLEAHDLTCTFKLVACSKCSQLVQRGQLRAHAMATCPLRQACCGFQAIGCASSLTQRELLAHMQESTQAHMALMLQALLEQQDLIRSLSGRVLQLEEQAGIQERERGGVQAALAGQVAALELKVSALEKKSGQDLKKVADSANAEAKKRADAATKASQKDMEPLRKELAAVKASLAELQKG